MKRASKIVATAFVGVLAVTTSAALWANSDSQEEHGWEGHRDHSEHRMKWGEHGKKKGEHRKMKGEHKKGCSHRGGKHGAFGKYMEREYSAEDIRTLTQAKLIKRGNPNIKVGEVKAIDNGYSVTIVTQDDSLVREFELAKNGMPLEKFQRIQKRMEASGR